MSPRADDLFTRLHTIQAESKQNCRNNPQELRRAGIWCASQALAHADNPAEALLGLLYAVGLKHDPDALARSATSPSKVAGGQHRRQT